MTRIRVDTDLLLQNAEALHARAESLRKNEEDLFSRILNIGGPYSGLTAEARKDAYAAQETIRSIRNPLNIKADSLAALARAFRSIDDETIDALLAMRGEGWFLQTFFPAPLLPDVDGFEAFYLPQSRMLLVDWVPIYTRGRNGLTQTDTFHTGRVLYVVVGTWTDPASGKKFYVTDLGEGVFGYIPQEKSSARIDLSRIINRQGAFANGQRMPESNFPPPFRPGGFDPDWNAPGSPWQYLILGNMEIAGIDGASFPKSPHANLCGELAVLFAVGEVDLEAGLSRFARMRGLGYWNLDGTKTEYTGTQVLQNVGHTTSAYDLRRFFEECGWEARISRAAMPAPDELAEKIRSGGKVIFLTELDTLKNIYSPTTGKTVPNPTYGQLVPGAPPATPGRAAHWVTVTDVFQDGDGKIFVQVFNPYSGCEEAYSWDTFVKTCQQPGTQVTGSYTYIEAAPTASRVG
jgi:hypothetical protein